MSRWIDADVLTKEIKQDIADDGLTERYVFYRINEAPSIDIVRCKECRWGKPYSDKQLKCDALGLGGLKFPDDFCSYGVRKTNTTTEEKPTPIRDYMVHGEREGE